MMQMNSDNDTKGQSKLALILSVAFILALVVAFFTVPSFNAFLKEAWEVLLSDDETKIRNWVDQYGWWGPVIIILTMTVQMFLLVIPTVLLMIVSVLAFGPVWGSLISYVAVLTATSVGYSVGKYFGAGPIKGLLGEKTFKKIESFLIDYGFWAIAISRINPFLSNDAISFVAGILKMNYSKYITATLLGITPLIVFIALTGSNTNSLKEGLLWGSVGSLVLFIAYVIWDKKRKKAGTGNPEKTVKI